VAAAQVTRRKRAPAGLSLRHELGAALHVGHGDVQLFRYVYAALGPQVESPRPYLHPVRTLDGVVVTDLRPGDHPWHRGISWALPVVGDHNFWGGPSYVHGRGYLHLSNNGAMVHARFDRVQARPDRVHIAHDLDWITEGGDRIVTEHRGLTVTLVTNAAGPHAWRLGFDTAMTNVGHEPIALGSPTTRGRPAAGYGGLFWRGPRSFTAGHAHAVGGSRQDDDLMGTRHDWVAFAAQNTTLVFADAAGNPGHPVQWYVRSAEFPGVAPAPFYDTETVLAPGDTLRLSYTIAVADGTRTAVDCAFLAAERQETPS
jgi:hypothetical protein